jgi:hypothetical protein
MVGGELPAYTRLGVGRSTTSRVIQTFKTEGIVETRRGPILLRRWSGCGGEPVFVTNPSKPLQGSAARGLSAENSRSGQGRPGSSRVPVTKLSTTHCFPAISDYIAPQRAQVCPVLRPGFLLGNMRPLNFRFLRAIRKSGSPFSGEIALQPSSDPEEEL